MLCLYCYGCYEVVISRLVILYAAAVIIHEYAVHMYRYNVILVYFI